MGRMATHIWEILVCVIVSEESTCPASHVEAAGWSGQEAPHTPPVLVESLGTIPATH